MAGVAGTDRPVEPPPGVCWCCGSAGEPARMVHLGEHPEVSLCLPCARWAALAAWEIEDRDRTGPTARLRGGVRRLRRSVVDHGWHRHPVVGRPLRWLGRHLP